MLCIYIHNRVMIVETYSYDYVNGLVNLLERLSSNKLTLGVFTQIAFSYSQASSELSVFINGVTVKTITAAA